MVQGDEKKCVKEITITQEAEIKSFAIDAATITKIWEKYLNFCDGQNIKVEFRTTKNKTYTSENIEQLLQFNNPTDESITEISISCIKSYNNMMIFNFGSYAYNSGCRYKIQSFDSWVSVCSREFDQLISGIRTNNEKNRKRFDPERPIFYLLGGAIITIFLLVLIDYFTKHNENIKHHILIIVVLFGILSVFSLSALVYIQDSITKFVASLFPTEVFLIGQGEKRYKEIERLRSNIFWGVLVCLMISLIVGAIFFVLPFIF